MRLIHLLIFGMVPAMKMQSSTNFSKNLSRVVLGTMIVHDSEREKSFALLDAALDAGITAFDLAWVYGGGGAERGLGDWCKARGVRDRIFILDKGCHPNDIRKRITQFDLKADLFDALARLKMDVIDVYMLHRDDTAVPVGEIVGMFQEHIKDGRIRAYGFSNWTVDRIQSACEYATKNNLIPPTASSPNYGLAEQVQDPWGPGCVTISGPAHEADREWYARSRMNVFAYSSLGRGLFSGRINRDNFKTVADGACQTAYCHEVNFERLDRASQLAKKRGVTVSQIALAYVLTSPMNMHALVGAATAEECKACVQAASIQLTEADRRWLDSGRR